MTTKKLIYTDEELPQRSDEWLKFRLNGLGGSEVPVIMGDIPVYWRTPYDLFLAKLGKPQPLPNKAMLRGTELEDEAIQYLTNYLNLEASGDIFNGIGRTVENINQYRPENQLDVKNYTAIYPDFTHIFTSFDGVDVKNKVIFEIKCPSDKNFMAIHKKKEIPKYYKAQVQAQLLVANAHWGIDTCIFANYHPEGIKVYNPATDGTKLVKLIMIQQSLDKDYCEDLVQKCKSFWEMVDTRVWKSDWEEDNKDELNNGK